MLEKISWPEVIISAIILGILLYIVFALSFMKTALSIFKQKITWSNIKKMLIIFKE